MERTLKGAAGKPPDLREIDEAVGHLERRFRGKEAKRLYPESLRLQLAGLLRHWYRRNLEGHGVIHPGIQKMAEWAGCTDRTAQENTRRLERYGALVPVDHQSGGRGNATEFRVDINAILRLPKLQPTSSLIEKFRALRRFEDVPMHRAECAHKG